jgi:hypothetical protein
MNRLKRAAAKMGSLLDKYYRSVPVYRLNITDKLIGVVTAAFFFVLYLLTCSHVPNIAGDAPELIAGSYSLGILHPPSYPLYTLIGYVFSHIPIGSIAFRVNMLSVVAHTLTLLFLFVTLMKITRNRAASIISVAILGFSSLFWFYSLMAEVFPLSSLFAVLLILVAILVRDRWVSGNRTGSERLFLFFAFLCGLSLTHHHTILLIFPALLLFILHPLIEVIRKPKRLISAVLLFLLGLVPYIYLPIRASMNPYMNFADPSSLGSFYDTVARSYYGSTQLWSGPEAVNRLDMIFDYFLTLNTQVYMVGIIVGVLGMFRMAKKRIADFVPLMAAFFFAAILFPWMANVEVAGIFERSTIERFYILPIIIFFYFIAMGFAFIFNWIKETVYRSKLEEDRKKSASILAVLLAILLIAPFFLLPVRNTARNVNLKDDCFGEAYIHNVLQSVEDGAILYLDGDIPIWLIGMYHPAVDEDPRDIIFIAKTFWALPWYMETLRIWYPDLEIPDMDEVTYSGVRTLGAFRAAFLDYIVQNNPEVTGLYTIYQDPNIEKHYDLIPYGFVYKAVPKGEELDFDSYYRFYEEFAENLDRCGLDFTQYTNNRREIFMIMEMSRTLSKAAKIFEGHGRLEEAQQLNALAYSIFPSEDFQSDMAYAFLKMGRPQDAYPLLQNYLDEGSAFNPDTWRAMLELEEMFREADGE